MVRLSESKLKAMIAEAIRNEFGKDFKRNTLKKLKDRDEIRRTADYYLDRVAVCRSKKDWDGFYKALHWLDDNTMYLTDSQLADYYNSWDFVYDEPDSLNESVQQKIDNFDLVSNLLDVPTPDNFHFVQITKRFKDNKNDDRRKGNYHGGSWYLGGFRIHNAQELMALKPKIVSICDRENARAYITINNRSDKETDSFIKVYQKRYPSYDARHIHADQIVPGQAKDGPNWRGTRKRVLVDIDVPKTAKSRTGETIWDETHKMIQMVGITPIAEYETPSGGLHIILPDKEDKNFEYLKKLFEKFDNWLNKGRNSTVHPNVDAKIVLYSNVKTKGY